MKFSRYVTQFHQEQQQEREMVMQKYHQQQQDYSADYDDERKLVIVDSMAGAAGAADDHHKLHVDVEDVLVDVDRIDDADDIDDDASISSSSGSNVSIDGVTSVDSGASSLISPASITMHNPHLHKALTGGGSFQQMYMSCGGGVGAGVPGYSDLVSDTGSMSSGVYSPTGSTYTLTPPDYLRRVSSSSQHPVATITSGTPDAASGGGGGKVKKSRRCRSRNRLRWSGEQLKTMEHYFTAINAYPSLSEYQALARILDVSVKHVQIWFTNRRVKYKRLHRQKAVKNPLSSRRHVMQETPVSSSSSTVTSLLGMPPLYQPTFLTTPVHQTPGAGSPTGQQVPAGGDGVTGETGYYTSMSESIIPSNINPIQYVTSLPLTSTPATAAPHHRSRNSTTTTTVTPKPEKICSVVVRDSDQALPTATPSPVVQPPAAYSALYDDERGSGGSEQPLDLSVNKRSGVSPSLATSEYLTLEEYRKQVDDLQIASSALLHLSGGDYNMHSFNDYVMNRVIGRHNGTTVTI